MVWRYVPFGAPDQLTGLGIHASYKPRSGRPLTGICFMVCVPSRHEGVEIVELIEQLKLELVGDINVGAYQCTNVSEYTREINSRSVLVTNVPAFNQPISYVSIESDGASGVPITRPRPSINQPLVRTSALLSGAAELRVYEEAKTGFCRGVVVVYRNGATKALGECRLGEHAVKVYEAPTHVCMKRRMTRGLCCKDLKLMAVRDEAHQHSRDESVRCFAMNGRLEFLFDKDHIHIDHVYIASPSDDDSSDG